MPIMEINMAQQISLIWIMKLTTHPLNSQPTNSTSNLGGKELGHGCILYKVLASLLLSCGVVDQCSSGGDLGVGLRNLVLHALEITYQLSELFSIVPYIPRMICQLETSTDIGDIMLT
jgi:hypothetical protein